jgi:hypothetical protein
MRKTEFDIPKSPEWRQSSYKDIVRDAFEFRENLPLPLVCYPDVYGTWIVFREQEFSQPVMCSCQRPAVLNFLRFNQQRPVYILSRGFSLVDHFIPPRLRGLNQLHAMSLTDFERLPFFRDRICHVCNRHVPPIRWSNSDEISIVIQHFGWYFQSALYAAGISPSGDVLRGSLDPELLPLIEVDPDDTRRRLQKFMNEHSLGYGALDGPPAPFDSYIPGRAAARKLNHTLKQQTDRIHRIIEERFRTALGFPPHGKTGGSETLLWWIVIALFPKDRVLFRTRPDFLDGLQLDIFLPDIRLGIEYQGNQHYEPFDHLGGERQLREVRRRDKKKAALCKKAGIRIEYFTIEDKLTEDYVAKRLCRYMETSIASH